MEGVFTLLILGAMFFLVYLAFWGRDAERDLHLPEPNYQRKIKKRREKR